MTNKQSQKQYAIGMVGLGVMGWNLVLNMSDHGFSVAGYDKHSAKAEPKIEYYKTIEALQHQLKGTTHPLSRISSTISTISTILTVLISSHPLYFFLAIPEYSEFRQRALSNAS